MKYKKLDKQRLLLYINTNMDGLNLIFFCQILSGLSYSIISRSVSFISVQNVDVYHTNTLGGL